jgi:16S rRNA (cytosine967-C5)-methyltransferase
MPEQYPPGAPPQRLPYNDRRNDNRNDNRPDSRPDNRRDREQRPPRPPSGRMNRIPATPDFVPTGIGAETPEQLEALRRGIVPQAMRIMDEPYVPKEPARGSDDIFYTDRELLYVGARGLAIKILSRLDQSDSYLDKLVEYELMNTKLSPLDRALVTEIVHGVTRWQSRLDWVLTGFYHGEFLKCIVPVKNAMRIALYQIMFLQRVPPFAAVNESVELIKRLKGARSANLVNAILRNILHNINNIRYPIRSEDVGRYFSVYHSHPFWLTKRWLDRYGEESTEALLTANNERPKISLRLNMMSCDHAAFLTFLDEQQVKHWESPHDKTRLMLVGSLSSVREWQPYQDGWFSVQDPSAAMVVRLAAPEAGQLVYDLCAAPGGKATCCAETMNDQGTIIALDKYAGKLRIIEENAKRLQLTSIKPQVGDARTFAPKQNTQPILADLVLVDAPCSGLGTLAKKPDIKWKIELADFPKLVRTQREILTNAAKLVKIGGAVVYSTCTIEPEENMEQITWFLAQHPNFELDRAEKYLPDAMCAFGCMHTYPQVHQADGAFAARLVRTA